MRSPAFFGPAYISAAKALANCECINLYPEVSEVKGGKAAGGFYTTPGLTYLTNLGSQQSSQPWTWGNPDVSLGNPGFDFSGGNSANRTPGGGPVRGQILMNGTLYVVSGSGFYSVDKNFNPTNLGTVTALYTPVSMITNGTQIAIFDGNRGFVYIAPQAATAGQAAIAQSFAAIDLPFQGPLSATYQDGFGLVNEVGTNAWWQSDLLDFITWDALNFSTVDSQPDDVIAVISLKRECWLLKQYNSEIWVNAGLPGFSFQRLEGVFIEAGIGAPYSLAKCGERIAFLSQDQEGAGIIVASNGYELERISTHYLEQRIQSFSTMTDAVGYSYQQKGHLFYVISFGAGNETWAYDFTASKAMGERAWHRRAVLNPATGSFDRHLGNNHAYAYGAHVIGDYSSGNLYEYDLSQATDNGFPRRWVRSWRALGEPMEDPTRFDSLRIDMQTGIGVLPGGNPLLRLRVSDDGGYNYKFTSFMPAGKTGETARRVKFRRLGSTKRNTGLDRMFELSSSDVFGVCLIGAVVE